MILGCLVLSEALILQWALLASGRAPLGPGGFVGLLAGVGLFNTALLRLVRRRGSGPVSFAVSRIAMVGSLGALLTGPPLLGALVVGIAMLPLASASQVQGVLVAGGGLAVAFGFGSILWGCSIGQRRVVVEHVRLPFAGLPAELAGVRIAHITDLHIGPQLRARRLGQLLDKVNALQADLIVITGDIFDFDPAFIDEGCRELARLEARCGVYAVLGNHDVYTGADAVVSGIAQHTKIRLLRDESVCVDVRGRPLHVIGIDDPGRAFRERRMESPALPGLLARIPPKEPRLLLMHRPSYFEQVARLGVPAALAGHTHGGQMSLPRPAQHYNVSRLMTEWTRGLFTRNDSVLYVSRGLGVAGPPIRLNCPREISLHELTPA